MSSILQRISAFLILFMGISVMGIHAQILHPAPGIVYDDSSLPRIDITISQSDLDAIYADPWNDQERNVSFSFTRDGTTEQLSGVGFRPRGNTSRGKRKLSFSISFNTFEAGRKFHNLERMNLNAETNDPSMVRSKLAWTVFRKLGIPACRENHVLLYINSSFHGVYNNTEHIDENFLKARFDSNDGNHYKCTWPADLAFRGDSQESYKHGDEEGNRVYELRINNQWDDYADLAGLISAIHYNDGQAFMEELESRMEVQQYLKIMAVDVMIGNWDGYIGNKNNYYLYRDPSTGRFSYIPYDLDNTFGLDWLGVDWAQQSIYDWTDDFRPLYEKVMAQKEYRDRFSSLVGRIAAILESAELRQEVERWHDQISAWVAMDPYYPQDFGFSYEDFQNSLDSRVDWASWVPYGVFEYAGTRTETALLEREPGDATPFISFARLEPVSKGVRMSWSVEDDQPGATTSIHYKIGEEEWQGRNPVQADWMDSLSGVPTYLDSISRPVETDSIRVYFTVTDQAEQETRYPLEGYLELGSPWPGPVLINEFMASNDASYADNYGEFDDWVEIYNTSSSQVWLGNLFLSDRKGEPDKFRLPRDYIYPHSFRLVWLDGQPEQGSWHAPFKISADGEMLRLSGPPSQGYPVLDSLYFGPQLSNVSTGRQEDGGLTWISFIMPTPDFSNLRTDLEYELFANDALRLWPNPVSGKLLHFNRVVSGSIFDLQGRLYLDIHQSSSVNLEGLVPGMYLFRSEEGEGQTFILTGGY